MCSEPVNATSGSGKKPSKKRKTVQPTPDVVAVSGNRSPFRNGAALLHKATQNRLRLVIQLLNAFPKPESRDDMVIDCLKDLLEGVNRYRTIWMRLSEGHKKLMVSFVSHYGLSLSLFVSLFPFFHYLRLSVCMSSCICVACGVCGV